jgi:endogenous inhibitor of DNA gyrase (YacG/DUF329 family)
MAERLTTLPCAICGKAVRIEECKVNDFGEPVHEACYAKWVKARVKLDTDPKK